MQVFTLLFLGQLFHGAYISTCKFYIRQSAHKCKKFEDSKCHNSLDKTMYIWSTFFMNFIIVYACVNKSLLTPF